MKILNAIVWMIWYIVALLIVIIAIAVSVLHVITPNLDRHRVYIEKWVSHTLGMPVTVQKIEAHWDGIRPEVDLYGVTLLPKPSNGTTSLGTITLNNLHLELNLSKALFSLNLQPTGIMLDGLNLHIDSTDQGQLTINNLLTAGKQDAGGVKDVDLSVLIAWLQSQSKLVVNDSNVYLKVGGEPVERIYVKDLHLYNNGFLHELFATVAHDKDIDGSINLGIRIHGDLTKPENLNISAFANFSKVEFTSWWQQPLFGYQIKKALIDGKIWLNWNDGKWQTSQINASINGFDLLSLRTNKRVPLDQFAGQVVWQPAQGGWQLYGRHFFAVINQRPWPELDFMMADKNNQQELQLGYLNVQDVKQMLQSFVKLPDQWNAQLNAMSPAGELTNIQYVHTGSIHFLDRNFVLSANLHDLALAPYQAFPAVSGLNAYFCLSPTQGEFQIHSPDLVVDFPRLFTHSLTAGDVQADVTFKQADNRDWFVDANKVSVVNEDGALVGDAAVQLPHDGSSPVVSMLFGYQEKNPAVIKQYFPERFFDKDLSGWLNQAFISGKPGGGTFLLRGSLSSFPYPNNDGIFLIDTNIRDLQFQYAPGWPMISNLNGELLFRNNSMSATGEHAKIYHTDIKQVTARIPAISGSQDTMLTINANGQGDLSDILRLLKESPLKNEVGSEVQQFQGTGLVNTQLALQIPLDHPDNTKVDGMASLQKVNLAMTAWNVMIRQLQGDLHFTEHGLTAKQLTMNFLGYPTTASIAAMSDENNNTFTRISVDGKTRVDELTKSFKTSAFSPMTGAFPYQAQIDLHTAASDKALNAIIVNTDLDGMAIDLPEPLGKPAARKTPVRLEMLFGQAGPMNVYLEIIRQAFSINGVLSFKQNAKGTYEFYSGDVALGDQAKSVVQAQPGLIIHGYLSDFNWQAWYAFFELKKKQYLDQEAHPQELAVSFIPRMVDITFGKLSAFNETLSPVNIQFHSSPQAAYYNVDIESSNIKGGINVPVDYPKGILTAKFDHVYLMNPSLKNVENTEDNNANKIDPSQFSAMAIQINDFRWANYQIQNLSFDSAPENRGMLIKQLSVDGDLLSGQLSGAWSLINNQYHTSVSGHFATKNYTQLIEMLGLNSSLQANSGDVQFILDWPDAPYHFAIDRVQGNLAMNLDNGTVKIDDQATQAKLNLGRIISLLSVDNIFSGFSNLGKKGYVFDLMHGEVKMDNGLMTLSNTYFNGPVARLEFSGLVNTVIKTVNLNLAVMPQLTSSLPVVAGIATLNPLVGVATYVAEKLFTPAVNQVVAQHYTITGPFSDIKISPVKS